MGTRFIFNTKSKIGADTIQLKHKGLWLSKSNTKKITMMMATSRAMISSTIAAVVNRESVCKTHAATYFKCTPSSDEWDNIAAKLQLTYGGLSGDTTLKLGANGNFGYVTASVVNAGHVGSVIDEDGDHISYNNHTLHVSKKRILKNSDIGAITIIHEASHKYANSFDHDDRGYREADDSDWWTSGLTKSEALNNADSFAYFCFHVGRAKGIR